MAGWFNRGTTDLGRATPSGTESGSCDPESPARPRLFAKQWFFQSLFSTLPGAQHAGLPKGGI